MKQHPFEEIERRKNRVESRLDRQSWPDRSGRVHAGGNEQLEVSQRIQAMPVGGIGPVHPLVPQIGLPELIEDVVQVFKRRCPYHESGHVLNLAYNIVCGGRTLDDLERLRQDVAYMVALERSPYSGSGNGRRLPAPSRTREDRRPCGGDLYGTHTGLEEERTLLLRSGHD